MIKKALKVICVAIAAFIFCVSCTKDPSNRIIGTWKCVEGHFDDGTPTEYGYVGDSWSFNKDKVVWIGDVWMGSSWTIDYTLTDKYLTIGERYDFEILKHTNRELVVKE